MSIETCSEIPDFVTYAIKTIKALPEDYTHAFWTCHSSGNLVDGLPLAKHKDAVLASCRFSRRATMRIFRSKILDDAYTSPGIVRDNFEDSILSHIDASKLASERSNSPDHRRVLSVSIFRKC